MSLFDTHKYKLTEADDAIVRRYFYAAYPENPKAYDEALDAAGKAAFAMQMNNNFVGLQQGKEEGWIGEEVSPYLQVGLGIRYPSYTPETLISNSKKAFAQWKKTDHETRAGILIEALERLKARFFELAYATMHTTGQSFLMSFQASGPHAADRSIEAVALGMTEMKRFPKQAEWKKNLGKFDLVLQKSWIPVPKGISLAIGCSTFPTWNTLPGVFASLITGNVVIVKPHPKAVLPIALAVSELQKVLMEQGFDPCVCQLAADTSAEPLTKKLAEDPSVKIIDYTGSTAFGKYIESLTSKTVFTENAGINSVIMHSTKDLKGMMQNLAFSLSLYSGQMCTAPQNIFIPASGVVTPEGTVSFDDVVKALSEAITGLVTNPKAGPPTLGAIQNDVTLKRVQEASAIGGKIILPMQEVKNAEFEHARMATPVLIQADSSEEVVYQREHFGPIAIVIKCRDTQECIDKAAAMAANHGAITCLAYCTDEKVKHAITDAMNDAFTPVSFNLGGAAFVNQHAAFSDFHVTGGNPSGNASFTNPDFINRRFVWVGNREYQG